jgi:hypothetical protein
MADLRPWPDDADFPAISGPFKRALVRCFALAANPPYPKVKQRVAEPDNAIRKREIVPEELSEDMTAADICHALQDMQFTNGHALLSVDRGVRDYLVRALRQR